MELPKGFPRPRIYSGVGEGWWPLIQNLHDNIVEIDPDYKLDQVKEKFGGLRYYITTSSDVEDYKIRLIDQLISVAEHQSYKTCETCGQLGKLRKDNYWVYTSCNECMKCKKDDDGNKTNS